MKHSNGQSHRSTSRLVAILVSATLAVTVLSCSSDDGGEIAGANNALVDA